MADGREYKIVITDEAGEQRNAISGDTSEPKTQQKANSEIYGWMAVKRVTPYIKQAISYNISQVSVQTGRQEQQQKMQFAFDVMNEVGGIAQTIYFGAKWGGAPGAVIAAGASAISVGVSIWQKFNTLATNTNLENASLGLLRARTGGINIYTDNSR